MQYVLHVRVTEQEYAELVLTVSSIISVRPELVTRKEIEEHAANILARRSTEKPSAQPPPHSHKSAQKPTKE